MAYDQAAAEWQARALLAESQVDGQAWEDLEGERDRHRDHAEHLQQRLDAATSALDESKRQADGYAGQVVALEELTATCGCGGGNPETYEGPLPDCPVHGAVRAFNEASRELAEVTADRDRLKELADRQYQSICVLTDDRDSAQSAQRATDADLQATAATADRLRAELEHARADRQDLWDTRDKRNYRWMEAAERLTKERDAARAERDQAVRDVHAVNEAVRVANAKLATARGERGNLEVQARAYVRLLDAVGDACPGVTDPIEAVNRLRDEANAHEGELGDMRAKLSAAEAEVDRLHGIEASRDHWKRVTEAIQAGDHPIAQQIRRDCAADALEDAARRVCKVFDVATGPDVAKYIEAIASTTRTGARQVPTSGQPEAGPTEPTNTPAPASYVPPAGARLRNGRHAPLNLWLHIGDDPAGQPVGVVYHSPELAIEVAEVVTRAWRLREGEHA